MEECKCGRIADKLAKDVVEGVRTPDWAKNMLAGVPEQLSRAEYEILDEMLKEKNRPMKEKKTKKMTKAAAFEWLNNKKLTAKDNVYVNVLFKLFECGIEWAVGGQSFTYYGSDFLIIEGGKLFHCGNDGEGYWRSHHFEAVSVEDILSIEIVDEKKCSEEDALDLISTVGARLSEVLRRMEGHKHVVITEDDVILYDEGMSLYHSDPF